MPRARIREMAGMFKGPMSIGIWIGIAGVTLLFLSLIHISEPTRPY